MKLLFMGPNLAAGGAQRQWSILVPGLRERGHDARVLGLDGGGPFVEPLRSRGVPVSVISMRHQADLGRLLSCPDVRHFSPDVIITRGVSGMYLGQVLALLRSARHVYNDHLQVGYRLSARRQAMIKLIARRIDLVVGVSPGQASFWREWSLPERRFVVVDNGVEAPDVPQSRDELRRQLGVAPSQVMALLVASLRPEKRIPDFVEAMQRARRSRPELVGMIAGDGVARPEVERAIGGDNGVRLLGHRDDVAQLLKASDLFALSSAYEAAPMSILEAMAAALPVLATSVGSVPELVVDQRSGLLVPPSDPTAMADQLAALAADPRLRRRLGDEGLRRQRERWSAGAMVDRYEQLLNGLEVRR